MADLEKKLDAALAADPDNKEALAAVSELYA